MSWPRRIARQRGQQRPKRSPLRIVQKTAHPARHLVEGARSQIGTVADECRIASRSEGCLATIGDIIAEYRFNVYAGEGADRVMVLTVLCGLGADDSTPTGSFRVRKGSKLVNPAWRNPRTGEQFAADDPANPIGERWIGLEGTDAASARHTGIGIHGTVEQQSIGKQMSMGCVRLGDREVEVAYELIGDGSTVVIR